MKCFEQIKKLVHVLETMAQFSNLDVRATLKEKHGLTDSEIDLVLSTNTLEKTVSKIGSKINNIKALIGFDSEIESFEDFEHKIYNSFESNDFYDNILRDTYTISGIIEGTDISFDDIETVNPHLLADLRVLITVYQGNNSN